MRDMVIHATMHEGVHVCMYVAHACGGVLDVPVCVMLLEAAVPCECTCVCVCNAASSSCPMLMCMCVNL